MAHIDITHNIERMPSIEDRLGITIGGVMATVADEPDFDGEYKVVLMGR